MVIGVDVLTIDARHVALMTATMCAPTVGCQGLPRTLAVANDKIRSAKDKGR